jgi:hypothetical protein
MTNVVEIRARPRVYTTRESFIDAVRDEVFRSALRYKDIAHGAGVSMQTISNLASGKTRWPRDPTLFGVISTLRLGIRLERLR